MLAFFGCDVSRPMRARLDAGSCPSIASEEETPLHADVRCSPRFCTASISQRECSVRVTTSCEPAELEDKIEEDERIVFEPECIAQPAAAEPFLRIECPSSCLIDLFHT